MSHPLRIGLVCPYALDTPGGVQNHVLGLAHWLRGRGHRVRVLAPGRASRGGQGAAGHPDGDPVTSSGGAVPVRYNGSVARLGLGPTSATRVRAWLAAEPLDLLHLHEPLTPGPAWQALGRVQTPVVATFHTATPRSRALLLARHPASPRVQRITRAVAVSEAARRVVVEHLGLAPVVIGNGFEPPTTAAARSPRPVTPDDTGPRLAFVGRLNEPRKGLDVLLAAWPEIHRRWPGAQVVVAGSGRRRLPAGWTALGAVDDEERARLMSWCDVFVAPHRGRESFGLVLLEALSVGAELVVADLDAFLDVLAPILGKRAHPFTAGHPEALVEALETALQIRSERAGSSERRGRSQELAEARVATLCQSFGWDAVGSRLLGVYGEALSEGPVGR